MIPKLGAISVSVPGALDGWWSLHRRYGRLPWRELFTPAIGLCEQGVPVPQVIGYYIKRNLKAFLRPGSGVEETANAMHNLRTRRPLPRRGRGVPQSRPRAHLPADRRRGPQCLLQRPIAHTIERYSTGSAAG